MRNAKYVDILSGHTHFDSLSRAGSTHRAWQELPRHLRRRTASHNVRRVPLRLRNRSRAEVRKALCTHAWYSDLSLHSKMNPFRRKILGRSLPKRGKDRRELRSDALARRQSEFYVLETICSASSVYMILGDKKWLETHLWHAKRMHMENMWGYRLVGTYL
jgi:ribonuclease P/MRP protein subunit POP1